MSTQIVDAEVVEQTEDPGTELAPVAPPPPSLFKTDDPAEVVVAASKVADALKNVLSSQNMIQQIQGKGYVKVEGWQTLASMLGVVPVVVWTKEVDGGWEARVEARTLDGRVIGAAESMCTESEGGNWGKRATSNARRSMAQTRAISKALRGPLGFVVTLAGYQATPAEEMPVAEPAQAPAPAAPPVSAERADEINALITKALESGAVDGGRLAMTFQRAGWVGTAINGETAAELTDVMADKVQASLEADLKAAKS